MKPPPPYPRVPRLGAATGDDLSVSRTEEHEWLHRAVEVEEKLDGANVSIWMDDGLPRVAGRAGPGARDRAGQLGPLRAWTARRIPQLAQVIGDDHALYAEWLWLEHSLPYDVLPDHLVVLDIWSPHRGFLATSERDARTHAADLLTPPPLLTGVVGSRDRLEELTRRSRFRSGPAEGAVLRAGGGGSFQRCKWVRSDYVRRSDDEWRSPRRNRLART